MNPPPISDPSGYIPPPQYTPVPDPIYQARQDAEHLNLLKIFYFVMAGITALTGLMFLIHIIMGFAFIFGAAGTSSPKGPPPPAGLGWIFIVMGVFALALSETLAAFIFIAGKSLANRERKTLIQVVAALLCLNVPMGTALGVFTFIVLGRPTVAALFEANAHRSS